MKLKRSLVGYAVFMVMMSFPFFCAASQNAGDIIEGQTVTDIILNGSHQVVSGNAVNVEINSGSQRIEATGTVTNSTLYGGVQTIIGTAKDTTMRGGVQFVGGEAINTTIESGDQWIDGGVATDTTINGGMQYVLKGGKTTNTTINNGQSLLFAGALADGKTEINAAGEMIMEAGSRVTDMVINGGTLLVTDLSGETTSYAPAQIDKLAMNGGNISFLRDSDGDFYALNISELSGTGNFLFNSSLAERNSNFVTIEQGTGKFGVAVTDSGKEIADHTGLTVNLIHDQGADIDFSMVTAKGRSTGAVDGGTYMYTLHSAQDKDGLTGGNVWYLAGVEKGTDINELQTTPATDAVLSLATAGLNVMRGELDSLRAYRNNQTTERKHGEGNVWGQYLGKKSLVDTSNGAAYKLHQDGFELGGDIATDFDRGQLVTGGFVTLSDNKVNHARGGKSRVDSYGLGAYATWYDNRGFYVDGALKANRLESNLNARMTNGGSTSGNWHQYGISSAVEAGFTFKPSDAVSIEPFVRTTGTHINDANVTLSNGMKAQTGKARSLTAEAGTRVGTQFSVGKTQFAPYMHLGVEQEFAKSNQTTINGVNRFDNNLNGTAGKYGLGMSAQLADNVALYGEMNYRQGSYIEEPMQGTAGIRIGF